MTRGAGRATDGGRATEGVVPEVVIPPAGGVGLAGAATAEIPSREVPDGGVLSPDVAEVSPEGIPGAGAGADGGARDVGADTEDTIPCHGAPLEVGVARLVVPRE